MMFVVKAATRLLNASATTRPTATATMSPRMRKFFNPEKVEALVDVVVITGSFLGLAAPVNLLPDLFVVRAELREDARRRGVQRRAWLYASRARTRRAGRTASGRDCEPATRVPARRLAGDPPPPPGPAPGGCEPARRKRTSRTGSLRLLRRPHLRTGERRGRRGSPSRRRHGGGGGAALSTPHPTTTLVPASDGTWHPPLGAPAPSPCALSAA